MKTHSLDLRRLCCALLLAAAGSACSEVPSHTVSAAGGSASPATPLLEQIDTAIGEARCDNAQQCRTLPVGHKACGGPEGFKAYSTQTSNSALLARLAAQHAESRVLADKKAGMMSTCSVVQDPGATCSAGRCVLLKGGGGAPR